MLKVSECEVYYGLLKALEKISIEVKKGETVSIIGPNGAGKTTLLKAISGLLTPSSGTIEFEGVRLNGLSHYKISQMGVVHVPEGKRIFSSLTVLQSLRIASYTSSAKEKREESLGRVYEIFPRLKERASQLAGTLSGGERQMLAIGMGLMLRPKILMLDEPSHGLAPVLVDELYKTLLEIKQEGEMGILLVEQYVHRALNISDKTYVLGQGKLLAEGRPSEIVKNQEISKLYLGI